MNIISEFTVDNIRAAIITFLTANPAWWGEDTIHYRICGSGAWEEFFQTSAVLIDLAKEGVIESSGNNGFNHWSYRIRRV